MAVKIQLYGQLKQMAGVSELSLDVKDTDGLKNEIAARYPEINDLTYLIAVDRNIVQVNTPVKAIQELALLPPYSGG